MPVPFPLRIDSASGSGYQCGRMPFDPRTPVLVGVGTIQQRCDDPRDDAGQRHPDSIACER
jgi:hypothetical protein